MTLSNYIPLAIFTVVIMTLVVGHLLYVRMKDKQTDKLIEAVIAKNLTDYATAGAIRKEDEVEFEEEPEFVDTGSLDDNEFGKMIKSQLEKPPEEEYAHEEQ